MTPATDMTFVGLGIFLGGLFGLLSVVVWGIPLPLTASGGALVMGLVFGWLRSVYPFFGHIPEPAIWIFDTLGLCVFIGVVGLSAGPSFVSGLQTTGVSLIFVGLISALLPHTLAILFGHYVLKMSPLILLGSAQEPEPSQQRSAPCRMRRQATSRHSAIRCPMQSEIFSSQPGDRFLSP